MKIVCAPASFKETLTAAQAAQAMARGIRAADASIACEIMPVGDGGEGTIDALITATHGVIRTFEVMGPLGNPVLGNLGIARNGSVAFVELAQASGLMLVPAELRNPLHTTTFGTGQLIAHAIELGCDQIILCIGGSATVDGGTGIAQALGAKFFDAAGREMTEPMTGNALQFIERIDRTSMKLQRTIRIACDVTNPLTGPQGAAYVYGPQKGATAAQVRLLDEGLAHLAQVAGDNWNAPGAGAAGGAGFGLAALCNATLERGIELVLSTINFDQRCAGANLVLTGEGRLDRQSLFGKACLGVARRAAAHRIPTIAIVGSTEEGADDCTNPANSGALAQYISLTDLAGESRARTETAHLIEEAAMKVARELRR